LQDIGRRPRSIERLGDLVLGAVDLRGILVAGVRIGSDGTLAGIIFGVFGWFDDRLGGIDLDENELGLWNLVLEHLLKLSLHLLLGFGDFLLEAGGAALWEEGMFPPTCVAADFHASQEDEMQAERNKERPGNRMRCQIAATGLGLRPKHSRKGCYTQMLSANGTFR
jgi:hypothetical protein